MAAIRSSDRRMGRDAGLARSPTLFELEDGDLSVPESSRWLGVAGDGGGRRRTGLERGCCGGRKSCCGCVPARPLRYAKVADAERPEPLRWMETPEEPLRWMDEPAKDPWPGRPDGGRRSASDRLALDLFLELPPLVQAAARGEVVGSELCAMLAATYGDRLPGEADLLPPGVRATGLWSECAGGRGARRRRPRVCPRPTLPEASADDLPKETEASDALERWLTRVSGGFDARKRVGGWAR